MLGKKKKEKNLSTIVDAFRKQDSEVRIDDFRDLVIKIPDNISAEVPEDKNGFLFDSNTGRVYALNKTASFIFQKIKSGMSLSEVVKSLTTHYDADEGIAVSDIQDFLYQLREFGIDRREE